MSNTERSEGESSRGSVSDDAVPTVTQNKLIKSSSEQISSRSNGPFEGKKWGRMGEIERKIAEQRAKMKQSDKQVAARRIRIKEANHQSKMRKVTICGKTKLVLNEGGPGPGEYDLTASDVVVFPSTGKNVSLGKKYPEQYDPRRDLPSPADYETSKADDLVLPCSPRQIMGLSTREDRRKVFNGISDYVPGDMPGPGSYDWIEAAKAESGQIHYSIDGSTVKRTVEIRRRRPRQADGSSSLSDDGKMSVDQGENIGPGHYNPSRGEAIVYPSTPTPALCNASKDAYLKTYMGKALTRKSCDQTPGYEHSDITSTFQHPMYKSTSKTIGQKTDTVKIYRPVTSIKPKRKSKDKKSAFSWLDPDYEAKVIEQKKQQDRDSAVINRAVIPRLSGFSFSLQRVARGTPNKSDTPGPIYAVSGSMGDRANDPVGPSFPKAKRCQELPKCISSAAKKKMQDKAAAAAAAEFLVAGKRHNNQESPDNVLENLFVLHLDYFQELDPQNEICDY